MDLKDIMLSKISQKEKDKYSMVSLLSGILKEKKSQTHSNSRKMVAMGWGVRDIGRDW